MSIDTFKTSKLLQVFEALTEMGFQGHSVEEIAIETGFSYAAVRRSLITLENHGWVVEAPQSGTKQKLWVPGEKPIAIAHKHRKHLLSEVNRLKQGYRNIADEELL